MSEDADIIRQLATERNALRTIVLDMVRFLAQDGDAEIDWARPDLADLVDSYVRSADRRAEYAATELERLRTELIAHRNKANGNYWAWQGDEEDHPESLVCPILIPAEKLRELLADKGD